MSNPESTTDHLAAQPGTLGVRRGVFADGFARFESLLAKLGDRLNPILVKEARQALKSRQFTITFILVLAAGWCWSIVGVAWMGPGVYWAADGPSMFYGYFLILAFPLVVIVPFGAYRSLAGEREDRTYELLSITTLRPRQIVGGKVAGAVLQMLVYLSAISPCLAFTYLLRGLDILTIAMIILYLFFGSLGLSLFCLLLATAINEKYQQVAISVGLVFGLGYAFLGACIAAGTMLSWNVGFDDRAFWILNAALLTQYISYFTLFYLAAAAQLSFVGSNRSTPLRITTLAQQALFLAWIGGAWLASGSTDTDPLAGAALIVGLHWFVMGVFMTGEPSRISPRVMRDLPQSFLGRAFFTWFNPGPASGYLFAITNFLGAAALILTALAWSRTQGRSSAPLLYVPLMCGLCLSYLAVYLGLGRIILARLARYMHITVASRVLIHVLLVFVGTVVPLTIHMTLLGFRNEGYTLLQVTNPFWTLSEAFSYTPPHEIWTVAVVLGVVGLIVFALNLPAVAEEVRLVRIAAPQRVAEEDAEIAAAHAPAVPLKTSPWD